MLKRKTTQGIQAGKRLQQWHAETPPEKRCCVQCGEFFYSNHSIQKCCSLKCTRKRDAEVKVARRKEWRKTNPRKPMGGPRKGSGRSIAGVFRGIYCQSRYELAFVCYFLDQGFVVERNEKGFPYKDRDGKEHLYYPDFIVNSDLYIEVKGWFDENVQLKNQQFPGLIKLINKEAIQKYSQYAKTKYGVKDVADLYESKLKKRPTGICPVCLKEFEKRRSHTLICSSSCCIKNARMIQITKKAKNEDHY